MKRRQAIVIHCILFFLGIVFIETNGWAMISVVHPDDQFGEANLNHPALSNIPETSFKKPSTFPSGSRSHTPEPATLALFGGGILGMFISFVRRTYELAKRFFDIVFAIIGLVLSLPLLILAASLIKLTSMGPIFYHQTRVGKNGCLFNIYKLRTMCTDAEKETGPVWAAMNDSRLIPIGRFLRKAHLDEIPQFINVLKGEMSIIGPRPERPVFVEQFKNVIPDYEKRLSVKPGITGLAQVWHKYDETIADVPKKVKYDLLYIKKVCLWTDLRIFFRTIRVMITGEGAR